MRRRHDVMHDVIKRAQVLCTTAIGAGSGMVERYAFGRVLIDEASQATELATIVPLCHGCEQLVLLGDHCQLPPTVSSDAAISEGLALSLFERLVQNGVQAHLLSTQYRMNPAISAFPSRHFYAGRLDDGVSRDRRPPLDGFRWPQRDMPMCLISISGREVASGTSYENADEAEKVVQVVLDLLKEGDIKPKELGVVTPYGAQVRLLRRLLQRAGVPTFRDKDGVEVASVDGYQGREKEGIIMSTVRSSRSGGIGFVADWRRANVALTRARRGVIVVGNPSTLARDEGTWLPWLHWIESNKCYQGQMPSLAPIRPDAPRVGMDSKGTTLNSTPDFRLASRAKTAPAEQRPAARLSLREVGKAGPSPERRKHKKRKRSYSASTVDSASGGSSGSGDGSKEETGSYSGEDEDESGSEDGSEDESDSPSPQRKESKRKHRSGKSRSRSRSCERKAEEHRKRDRSRSRDRDHGRKERRSASGKRRRCSRSGKRSSSGGRHHSHGGKRK